MTHDLTDGRHLRVCPNCRKILASIALKHASSEISDLYRDWL